VYDKIGLLTIFEQATVSISLSFACGREHAAVLVGFRYYISSKIATAKPSAQIQTDPLGNHNYTQKIGYTL